MQTLDLPNGYRLTVSEMSRKSQLAISTWFNEWITGIGKDAPKLDTVSNISTQVILHSRVVLYKDGIECTNGTYDIEEGVTIVIPLTVTCLDEMPASLFVWFADAAGQENALVLRTFLAGVRVMTTRGTKIYERLSDSGRYGNLIQH
jgi:hypothetical protein